MKNTIIFPCRNEEQGLPECLEKAKTITDTEIIVVNNLSTDKSRKIAEDNGVRVIDTFIKGYGETCRRGIEYAQGENIILVDCDGSYDIDEARRLIAYLDNGYDFVIGNRFNEMIEKGAMPFLHRYLGSVFLRTILKNRGWECKEVSTGFIGIKKKWLDKMDLECSGMEFSTELILNVIKMNLKVKEIDIVYSKRKGKSKFRTFIDGARHYWYLMWN